jgi:hypothetical protein
LVDDTRALHAGTNGFCAQIGNDDFVWFSTRTSKSRLKLLLLPDRFAEVHLLWSGNSASYRACATADHGSADDPDRTANDADCRASGGPGSGAAFYAARLA